MAHKSLVILTLLSFYPLTLAHTQGVSSPKINFTETEFDFGELNYGESRTHVFSFANVGDDTLVIERVRSSCSCITAVLLADTVPPNTQGELQVTLDSEKLPKEVSGETSKGIYVHSNDPVTPILFLRVSAVIIPQIGFYFFYFEDCEDCVELTEELFPLLIKEYNLHMKSFELGDPDNYELLVKFEEKFNDTDNEVPVIIIGEYILGNKKEIKERFPEILKEYKENGCEFPNIEAEGDTVKTGALMEKVYMAYFYKKRCKGCDRVVYEIEYLENKYPNLVVKKFDIDDSENKKLNEALCQLYRVPEEKRLVAPIVFIDEEFLIEEEINNERLVSLIEKCQVTGSVIPWQEAEELKKKSESTIKERFNKTSVLTVLFAGLVDGVNPCAFATILFFIAFLSFIGKKGKEILLIGTSFTCSVFVVYFLIGIGIFSFVKNLTFMPLMRKVIFSAMAILAIIFGGLSIYDYFKFKSGKYENVKLQLPKFLKRRIHTDIREKMQMRNYILAAVVIGILVSLSEFVCTGQVYLPTLAFITTQVPSLKLRGLTYLFFYNLAFIVPLVIVFSTVYKGKTSTDLNLFWRRHGATAKLAISVLFFLLGGLLIFYAYY